MNKNTKLLIGGGVSLILLLIIAFVVYWFYFRSTVVIDVSPSAIMLNAGEKKKFIATVTGTTNTAVDWAVNDQSLGTINAAGEFTAGTTGGIVIVSATSKEDPSVSATAVATLKSANGTVPAAATPAAGTPTATTPATGTVPAPAGNNRPGTVPTAPPGSVPTTNPATRPATNGTIPGTAPAPAPTSGTLPGNAPVPAPSPAPAPAPAPPKPSGPNCTGKDIKRCAKLPPTQSRDTYDPFDMLCTGGSYLESMAVTYHAGLHGVGGRCSGSRVEKFFGGPEGYNNKQILYKDGKPPKGGYQRIRAWSGSEWDSVGKIIVYDKEGNENEFAKRQDSPERNFDCGYKGVITGLYGTTNKKTNMINTLGVYCGYKD